MKSEPFICREPADCDAAHIGRAALLRRFLRHPMQVGSCWPSSRALCAMLSRDIGVERARLVVELGPGTGVVTRELLSRLPDAGRLHAVELDESLCRMLREHFPGLRVHHASASRLSDILRDERLPLPDVIVSGLPWAIFPESLQRELLSAIRDNLSTEGWFATFTYLQGRMMPAGIRFRRILGEYFPTITTSPVVWRNLPPAFVYRCRK